MLGPGDELDIGDINMNMDLFFVVSGALEFTMRQDPLDHAREQYFANVAVDTRNDNLQHVPVESAMFDTAA